MVFQITVNSKAVAIPAHGEQLAIRLDRQTVDLFDVTVANTAVGPKGSIEYAIGRVAGQVAIAANKDSSLLVEDHRMGMTATTQIRFGDPIGSKGGIEREVGIEPHQSVVVIDRTDRQDLAIVQ